MHRPRAAFVFYYGTVIVISIAVLIPVLWIILTSFKDITQLFVFPPKWIPSPPTIKNFLTLVTRTAILRKILNSLIISAGTAAVSLGLAALAGYGFSRFRFKHKELLLIAVFSLQMLPVTVNIVPLYFFAVRLALVETYHGLIIIFSAIRIPVSIWILKGFFDSVPISIEESALVDGATRFTAFTRILLPLALPGLAAATLITIVFTWSQFLLPLIINSKASMHMATVGVYQLAVEESLSWHLLGAGTILSVAPVIILYLFTQKMFISGLTRGAGK